MAGRMRTPVTVETPVATADPYGNDEAAWAFVIRVYAEVTSLSDSEAVALGRLQSEVGLRVRTRAFAKVLAVTPRERLVIGGVPHAITAVRPHQGAPALVEWIAVAGVGT